MSWTEPHVPGRILVTAQNLSVDRVAVEVVAALSESRVPSILLKGASFAGWLYAEGEVRPYADVDLLVAPSDATAARAVLAQHGFRHLFDSQPYFVRGHDAVDLHCSIKGIGAREDRVWELLSTTIEPQEVNGFELQVLAPPARALHVALHAAQHGPDWPTQMEDLRRALAILPFEMWEAAAQLASKLDATPALATGLCLAPEGEAVSDRLNLTKQAPVQTILRAKSPPPLAMGFEELGALSGIGAKTRFVARKLFPSRSYMRAMMPIARRGRSGLLVAYCRRVVWLLRHAVPGFRAWRQSRREAASRGEQKPG